jgi:hypothetical protein
MHGLRSTVLANDVIAFAIDPLEWFFDPVADRIGGDHPSLR